MNLIFFVKEIIEILKSGKKQIQLYAEENICLKEIIESKESKIRELKDMTPETNPLEEELNSKYPKAKITYSGRTIPNFGEYELDVRNFFINPNSSELQRIVSGWKDLPDDEKALRCQKWVKEHIKYTSDKSQYGLNEFWEYPSETLKTKKSDCDGMNLLLGNLMIASGIPYWKVRASCGDVYDENGKNVGGHCFITYFVEKRKVWVAHDTTYFPDMRPVSMRDDYKDSILYGEGEVWFSFNQKFAFAKI